MFKWNKRGTGAPPASGERRAAPGAFSFFFFSCPFLLRGFPKYLNARNRLEKQISLDTRVKAMFTLNRIALAPT